MPIKGSGLPAYIQEPRGDWIVVEENRRKARFRRPESGTLLLVHVDGGLITEGERADYILAHSETVDVIIELKGADVGKAVRQILATRPVWLRHERCGMRHGALVVRGKGIHPKLLTKMERWTKEFRRTHKMRLVIETRNRDYEFHEFLLPDHA